MGKSITTPGTASATPPTFYDDDALHPCLEQHRSNVDNNHDPAQCKHFTSVPSLSVLKKPTSKRTDFCQGITLEYLLES
jgi:hypothetical protein